MQQRPFVAKAVVAKAVVAKAVSAKAVFDRVVFAKAVSAKAVFTKAELFKADALAAVRAREDWLRSRLFRTFCLVPVGLLAACSVSTIDIIGSYPSPLVRKLPLTIGVYYPDELRNYSFVEIDDYTGKDEMIVNSGASQVELFNTMLPALFENVVMLESLDGVQANDTLDAVFVPVIEEFQLGLPDKTKLKVYEIWVKYNMRLSQPNGDYIADWVMTAYGKAPRESFQSEKAGVQDAAVVAMRDLAATFTLGFAGIPEVDSWLRTTAIAQE